MSGFVLIRGESRENRINEKYGTKYKTVFVDKSMFLEKELHSKEFSLLMYKRDTDIGVRFSQKNKHDFIFYAGTIICKKYTGNKLLTYIFENIDEIDAINDRLIGNYVLIVHKLGKLRVQTDNSGLFRVYTDLEHIVLSSSLIAMRKLSTTSTIAQQELYEYMLCGTTYGDKTPIVGIHQLNYKLRYEFVNSECITKLKKSRTVVLPDMYFNLTKNVAASADVLLDIFTDIKSVYGNNISMPVTGGFDSRLMCACAHKIGITPNYSFVLHKDHQQDVNIAKDIAELYKWELSILDNEFPNCLDVDNVSCLKDQYYKYDGLGIGGVLQYFSGLDVFTRVPTQNLLLDGNGGEVFRNIYRLPNKPISLQSYVKKTIFKLLSSIDQPKLDSQVLINNICAKIDNQENTGLFDVKRLVLENLYPTFIIKNWLGQNNSIANQFCDFLTPFTESLVVNSGLQVPIKYKTLGWFEAELIKYIDPDLSKITSNYGHNFYCGINAARRFKEDGMIVLSNLKIASKIKNKLHKKTKKNLPSYAQGKYLQSLLDFMPLLVGLIGDKMIIEQYIDFDRITNAAQLSRLLSVEMLIRDLF